MSSLALTADRRAGPRPYFAAGAWALGVIALTGLHHAYGAVIYDTPWRLHILEVGIPVGLIVAGALLVAYWRRGSVLGRVALYAGLAAIAIFPVALIGLYEGGFNHVVKNAVFLGFGVDGVAAMSAVGHNPAVAAIIQLALGPDAYAEMMETSLFEPPGDVFFEATGVAQAAVAVVAAWSAIRLWRVAR